MIKILPSPANVMARNFSDDPQKKEKKATLWSFLGHLWCPGRHLVLLASSCPEPAAQSCGSCCKCKKIPCVCGGLITGIKPFLPLCGDADLLTSAVLTHTGPGDPWKGLVDYSWCLGHSLGPLSAVPQGFAGSDEITLPLGVVVKCNQWKVALPVNPVISALLSHLRNGWFVSYCFGLSPLFSALFFTLDFRDVKLDHIQPGESVPTHIATLTLYKCSPSQPKSPLPFNFIWLTAVTVPW